MSPRKIGIIISSIVVFIVLGVLSGNLVEVNDATTYQIKQGVLDGELKVRNAPGPYYQGLCKIVTYHKSSEINFSSKNEEGGSSIYSQPIKVPFQGGGTADVSGIVKYVLSLEKKHQISLHTKYQSSIFINQKLMWQTIREGLKEAASIMTAEEAFSGRRSEFISLAEKQITIGISKKIKKDDRLTEVMVDGKPVIAKPSPLKMYDIDVIQFNITNVVPDKITLGLILAKKNAEKAKQDTITEREKGNANIAKALAAEEVEKIKAVTQAQKEYEVSVLDRKKADEVAKGKLIKKKAEAEANQLLVAAGLTPLEKATIEKEMAIGVAEKLSQIKFPSMMVIGGGREGKVLNPFDAIGLDSFMRIQSRFLAGAS